MGSDLPVIWMVGTSLRRDGAPLSQFELADGLASQGLAVRIISPSDGPLRCRYETSKIPVEIRPELVCSAGVPSWYEGDVRRLADLLARERPALVLASSIDSFPTIDAARVSGVPSIWNIRESEPWRTRLADRHPAIAARALACFDYPEATVFVAEACRRAWGGFGQRDRQHVIYNAAHPEILRGAQQDGKKIRADLGVGPDDLLIVSVGTLCARKGQIDLVRALNMLPSPVLRRLRIAFIGSSVGDYMQRLETMLSPAARAQTTFLGEQDNAVADIAAADILVNTSRSEAFPRTFVEAAAARTAIVATAIDGALERLSDGRAALLYVPEEFPRLAEILTALASDPSLRVSLTEAAHAELIHAWTYPDMLAAYGEVITGALAEASAAGLSSPAR